MVGVSNERLVVATARHHLKQGLPMAHYNWFGASAHNNAAGLLFLRRGKELKFNPKPLQAAAVCRRLGSGRDGLTAVRSAHS